MEYRTTAGELFNLFGVWDKLIGGRLKIHLIACGGTALALLGCKESTKDMDLLIPEKKEFEHLSRFLEKAGYHQTTEHSWQRPGEGLVLDLFVGKRVYVTELLDSPLKKGGHRMVREWKRIYLGILNPIDLIISKMFRGSQADLEDCIALAEHERIDLKKLEKRYRKTASFDVSENRVLKNLEWLLREFKEKKG